MRMAHCHCSIHSKVEVGFCLLLAFLFLLCSFLRVLLDFDTVLVLLCLQASFSFLLLFSLCCCSSSALHLLQLRPPSLPLVGLLPIHLEGDRRHSALLVSSPFLSLRVPAMSKLAHRLAPSRNLLLGVVDERLNSMACPLPNLSVLCPPLRLTSSAFSSSWSGSPWPSLPPRRSNASKWETDGPASPQTVRSSSAGLGRQCSA